MGVQTFSEKIIHKTGRKYTLADEMLAIVKTAQSLGLWVSLDLMVGLANQTAEQFHKDIEEILRIKPDQLAIYPLIQIKGVAYGFSPSVSSAKQYRLFHAGMENCLIHPAVKSGWNTSDSAQGHIPCSGTGRR